MTSALLSFAVVAGLLTLVPGVDTAIVLRNAITLGRSGGYSTALGIAAGLLVWGAAAAVGISAILTASQLAYDALRYAGALYLLWMGVRLLKQSRTHNNITNEVTDAAQDSQWTAFLRGFTTNLLNPKAGVFYMAVLPQFLPPDVSALVAGVALALVHVAESLLWFSILIFGTHLLRSWFELPSVRTWLDRVTGSVLIAFGMKVAWS